MTFYRHTLPARWTFPNVRRLKIFCTRTREAAFGIVERTKSSDVRRMRALCKKLKTFFVESYLCSFISQLSFITFRTNPLWWNSSYEDVIFWHSRHTYFPTYLRSIMHDHKHPCLSMFKYVCLHLKFLLR